MTKREEGKGSKGPFYVQRLSEEKSHFPRRHSEKTKHPKKPKTARDLYIRVQDGQVATSELNSFHLNTVFVPPSGASTGHAINTTKCSKSPSPHNVRRRGTVTGKPLEDSRSKGTITPADDGSNNIRKWMRALVKTEKKMKSLHKVAELFIYLIYNTAGPEKSGRSAFVLCQLMNLVAPQQEINTTEDKGHPDSPEQKENVRNMLIEY